MAKEKKSWSKPNGIPGLIGRKQVDWTIFENGSHIPQDFTEDFLAANGGIDLASGEARDVTLDIDGIDFTAKLQKRPRHKNAFQIRYDSNSQLKQLLLERFRSSYEYLKKAREREGAGRGKVVTVPPSQAEYMEFYETGTPFRYRVKLIPNQARPGLTGFERVWADLGAIIGDGITVGTLSRGAANELRWSETEIEVTTSHGRDTLPRKLFEEAWQALEAAEILVADELPGDSRILYTPVTTTLALLPYVDYTAHPKITLFLTTHVFTHAELAKTFGVGTQGGIRWAGNTPNYRLALFITDSSDSKKASNPYHDRWDGETFYYTGEGLEGDQTLTRGNRVLHSNMEADFPVYGFEKLGKDHYTYMGRFKVVDVSEEQQPDRTDRPRRVYVFEMQHEGMGRPPERSQLYLPVDDEVSRPRSWVFQGNPRIYNVSAAVKALPEVHWLVNRYQDQIQPGDRVFLWESGPNAGVVATATVLTKPDAVSEPEPEKAYWVAREPAQEYEPKTRVRLRIDQVLDPRLPRQRLLDHAALRDSLIIKMPTGTNFPLTFDQAQALTDLVAASKQPAPVLDLAAIVSQFSTALRESHLHYGARHEELVRSFVAALATKRFVILTGLSGSGKTQLALRFGEWLGEERRKVVAVRPDWTGPEALFGYEDALLKPASDGRRAWHVPEALAFMLKAASEPAYPYLLILDEMNLAHVERYFADVLSGMESEEAVLPNLQRDPEDGLWRIPPDGPEKVPFPRNLFVVGTVNVDETTYMFSPKVLDRANTFEFRVEPTDLTPDLRKPKPVSPGDPAHVRGFLAIAQDDEWQIDHPPTGMETLTAHLRTLHTLLYNSGFEFGHRVFYESVRFAAMLEAAGNESLEHTLDRVVMQKILPRLHGTRRRLEPVLSALGQFCFELAYTPVEPGKAPTFDPLEGREGAPHLPLSFDKVRRMMRSLRANQFASFTE